MTWRACKSWQYSVLWDGLLESEVERFSFPVIGRISSCFSDKFGIPRQPGLAPLACASLKILPPYDNPEAFVGLAGVSHVWLQFVFHRNRREQWKPRVKVPRLGGNKTLGVFASRSPVRPSPLGLSVVRLLEVRTDAGVELLLGGVDLLDGTPVLDIKPYLPYADAVPDAVNAVAPQAPVPIAVDFSEAGRRAALEARGPQGEPLAGLIEQLLRQDPRPSYQAPSLERVYAMRLWDWDLRWRYWPEGAGWRIEVLDVLRCPPQSAIL
jgi:tRNA (adenine37-N6)-methyltransferase